MLHISHFLLISLVYQNWHYIPTIHHVQTKLNDELKYLQTVLSFDSSCLKSPSDLVRGATVYNLLKHGIFTSYLYSFIIHYVWKVNRFWVKCVQWFLGIYILQYQKEYLAPVIHLPFVTIHRVLYSGGIIYETYFLTDECSTFKVYSGLKNLWLLVKVHFIKRWKVSFCFYFAS